MRKRGVRRLTVVAATGLTVLAGCGDPDALPGIADTPSPSPSELSTTSPPEPTTSGPDSPDVTLPEGHPLAIWLGPDAAGTPGPNAFVGEAALPGTATLWRHDVTVTIDEATMVAAALGIEVPLVELGDGRHGWHTGHPDDDGPYLVVESRPGLTFGYFSSTVPCRPAGDQRAACDPDAGPVDPDVVTTAALAFLAAIGFGDADVEVVVGHGGPGYGEVRANMVLGGVPSDFGWFLTVGADGRLLNANGPVHAPEPVMEVALVSVEEVIGRMNRIGIVGVAPDTTSTSVAGEPPPGQPTGLNVYDSVSLRLGELPFLDGTSIWLVPGYRFANVHGSTGPHPAIAPDAITIVGTGAPQTTLLVPSSGFIEPPPTPLATTPTPPATPSTLHPAVTLPVPPAEPIDAVDPERYAWYDQVLGEILIGTDLDAAVARLTELGWEVRVVDLDGPGDLTADERHRRVNVFHRAGVVDRVHVG